MEVNGKKPKYVSRKSELFTNFLPERPKPRISVFGNLDLLPSVGPGRITVDPEIVNLDDSSNLLGNVLSNVARRASMRNSRREIIIKSIP